MISNKKNTVLVLSFIFALIICYLFAIRNTLDSRKEYNKLKKQEVLFKNAPKQLSILKQKSIYFDSLLTQYQINGSSIQNNLLKTLNTFADSHGLKIISFLEPHTFTQNNLTIKTYEFVVEGDYNNIITCIYMLEQDTKYGEIVNLHFEKKKNYRTGRHYLQAKVLLKSFHS